MNIEQAIGNTVVYFVLPVLIACGVAYFVVQGYLVVEAMVKEWRKGK